MSDAAMTDAPEAPSVEARARAQGWRPKEEFRGDPERWRPAEDFLKAAETFMPVAIERNRALETKLAQADGKIDALKGELGEVKQVLTEFREFASKGEQRAYEKAKKELMAQREVAVSHADTAAFREADAQLAELEKSVPANVTATVVEPTRAAATAAPVVAPEVQRWIAVNPWFHSDPVAHQAAKAIDGRLMASQPDLAVEDRLAMVRTEMQRRFPEHFENDRRETATAVASPSGAPGRKANKHSYDNLPPEAKKACDKFVKTIPGFKVEDYVRDYDWDSN